MARVGRGNQIRVKISMNDTSRFRRFFAYDVCLCALVGCGSNLGMTGGSVPVGAARLAAQVVSSDTSMPVPNAVITVTFGSSSVKTITDGDGRFILPNIAGASYKIAIAPPVGSRLTTAWEWTIPVPDGQHLQLLAELWSNSFDISKVQRVRVQGGDLREHVGEEGRIESHCFDGGNNDLGVHPSLLFTGNFGTLQSNGTIKGLSPGSGTVTAWLNNHTESVNVNVDP